MAITGSTNWLDAVLEAGRTVFQQKCDQIRKTRARRTVYCDTYQEFSALTDGDLRDIGISRSNIKRLAREAAHDH
ncbi:DUF1127 domain-containing protein [Pseudohalocynthiibacter sp. F2068]|jgi:uncharacterized protein YjiS (DUF1127 family)|uniref:DUF1127 domain-containing protein n=1 Tax=Pseudohalocynthiibacter sp. F2068 TaxID=2926418 RepID=UPI001FF53667|nr:DUF1127 domain-containing protein [Pseudohalocynthiibacter sp. F2068]MCK0104446.1 DUF1127 domain-containing protein [Pseudohalocynthiibacter sp. F2068]